MVDLHRQYLDIRLFEEELARRLEVRHCIACGNGTDALLLSLLAVPQHLCRRPGHGDLLQRINHLIHRAAQNHIHLFIVRHFVHPSQVHSTSSGAICAQTG